MILPVITITGWRLQAIGDAKPAGGDDAELPFQRRMTYKMDWKSDIDYLSNETFNAPAPT